MSTFRRVLTSLSCALALMAISTMASDAHAAKWDCVVNKTGKTLRVVICSEKATITIPKLLQNDSAHFEVSPQPKTLVLVAFEYGTNKVVAMTTFTTLPQKWKPTNCYAILATAPTPVAPARDTEADHVEHEEPVSEESL